MEKGRYRVYVERDPTTGLFAARCLEMSVFSQGASRREAVRNIKAAIRLHLEVVNQEALGKGLIEVEV